MTNVIDVEEELVRGNVIKVGDKLISKEEDLYVVEKIEFLEDGSDACTIHDSYKTVEEAVTIAALL